MLKKHQTILSIITVAILLLKIMPIGLAQSKPIVTVEQITVEAGGSVEVPIRISNNTGICGATLSVQYDKRLILSKISEGTALSTLTMTKPGDLTANPISIGWDGMEEDTTNGVIATLTFTVPNIVGTYDIDVSYAYGDIVDGTLTAVNIVTEKGGIEVIRNKTAGGPAITVDNIPTQMGETVEVPIRITNNTGICGATLSVYYDKKMVLTEISQGSALSTLTMTKPGDLTANPISIGWDGLEEDTTNGVIATLTFKAPNALGIYDIDVSCNDGDIIDGDLAAININTEKGGIEVTRSETAGGSTVSIANASAQPSETLEVPIRISNNTGICGALLSVQYDERLVLTKIAEGDALSSLTMSTSGKLTENPISIGWDGLEEDATNGVLATLTFVAPSSVGTYDIDVSYTEGDIVDGNLSPINPKTINGQVMVGYAKEATVEIGSHRITLIGEDNSSGEIIVAFYNENDEMISFENYAATGNTIKIDDVVTAAYAKVMWWESLSSLRPVCAAETISLK